MDRWRIYVAIIVVFLLGGGILARLFSLQILQYDYYSALAQGQHQLYKKLFPQRGEILMQDLSASRWAKQEPYYPLAINKEFQQVYIIPRDIPDEEKETLAERLASLLDLDKEIILGRMNKVDDPYEPLKHKVDQSVAEQIKALEVSGLGLASETWRYYPNQSLACHLIGFVGIEGEKKVGQYGLEGYYENKLKGQVGFLAGEKDTAGYWIPSLKQKLEPARDGSQLILTIDQNIQFKAEKELKQVVDKWQAEGGTIIVMEPKSGAIRAMANWPCFNPNEYSKVEDINIFLNPAIQKVYEPGSVFKPITMAAGLDSGQITPETVYQDKGQVQIKRTIIRNVDGKAYGEQTMTQVLEKSLNTGAVFVQQKIGPDVFGEYIEKFGFGEVTGVDLSGEVGGDISNLFTGREINLANISFGQGITVTPLGLITALGAIANEGKLMRPFVVEKIINSDGQEIVTEPKVIRQVISPQTAKELTRMLVSVVENGFGRPARVAGYNIAGKTGTAQVPDLEKGGYSDETIHTFVGFAPAFDPQFIILVKLDKPQGIRFAADSVSPVFKRLAEYLFNYLEIPPQ
jgi:cell division protein FtsI/penicillin-binding protein 2